MESVWIVNQHYRCVVTCHTRRSAIFATSTTTFSRHQTDTDRAFSTVRSATTTTAADSASLQWRNITGTWHFVFSVMPRLHLIQVVGSICIACRRLYVSCIGDKIVVTATCIHLYPDTVDIVSGLQVSGHKSWRRNGVVKWSSVK